MGVPLAPAVCPLQSLSTARWQVIQQSLNIYSHWFRNNNNFGSKCCKYLANLCKSSEILEQCHVKWWLGYRIYGSVSYSFSCKKDNNTNYSKFDTKLVSWRPVEMTCSRPLSWTLVDKLVAFLESFLIFILFSEVIGSSSNLKRSRIIDMFSSSTAATYNKFITSFYESWIYKIWIFSIEFVGFFFALL